MSLLKAKKLKNIAIVAHVDHGKTTLVDVLLRQSGAFADHEVIAERVMDSGELERERGITIRAKNCAIYWKDCKINLLDTPGHSDFGGEVERSIMMVDGVLLLVDAAEGPLPQTRFVLQKALERGLKIGVVINKVDRSDARIDEVRHEIEELFLHLAELPSIQSRHDIDLDFPFLYASSREGWATHDPKVKTDNLIPILDLFASDYYPEPTVSEGDKLQLLVANLSYSPYLGTLMVGRIQRGSLKKFDQVALCGESNKTLNFKVTSVQVYNQLQTVDLPEDTAAPAGEIVILAGTPDAKIGDTLCSVDCIEALPRVRVEPPTVSVEVSVNTSPYSGKEGTYLTSRKLEEFLQDSCRHNVALQYSPTEDPKVFMLKGRGELQLAIVFEELRRQGYELMIARPQVLFRYEEYTDEDGNKSTRKLEPFEKIVLDVPDKYTGVVTEKLSQRKGKLEHMTPLGIDRVRMEFVIPSRALIGYRGTFLTDTRGEGLMSAQFLGYMPYAGDLLSRQNGAIISDRAGKTTPYALFNLLNLGIQFIRPGDMVYEGMVIGEHNKKNDNNVNCIREKHLSSVRTAGKDANIILPPLQDMTLERAIDWIDNDEWIEITPKQIRIRKKILPQNQRTVIR